MTGGEDDIARPRPKRAKVTGSERELWDHVARSVVPLRGKQRVSTQPSTGDEPPPRRKLPEKQQPLPATEPLQKTARKPASPPRATPKPAVEPDVIDRRKSRRIAKGHEQIEARIDLHGMRQAEAHHALRRFILGCHAAGRRRVLIITGKGTSAAPQDDWTMGERERGVLRRNVPRWLAEPDLAAMVIAIAPAHARHGGDGALYVTLRRAKGGE